MPSSSLLSLVSPLSLQPSAAAAARKVIGAHAVYLPCSTCSVLTYALRKGGCAGMCAPMWASPLRHKGGQRTPPPRPRPRRSKQHPLFPRTIHSRKNRPGFKSVRRAGGDGLLLLLHAATNACDDGGRGLCPIIPPCCTYVHTRGGGGGSQGPLPSLLSLSIPRDRPAAPTLIELESLTKRRQ